MFDRFAVADNVGPVILNARVTRKDLLESKRALRAVGLDKPHNSIRGHVLTKEQSKKVAATLKKPLNCVERFLVRMLSGCPKRRINHEIAEIDPSPTRAIQDQPCPVYLAENAVPKLQVACVSVSEPKLNWWGVCAKYVAPILTGAIAGGALLLHPGKLTAAGAFVGAVANVALEAFSPEAVTMETHVLTYCPASVTAVLSEHAPGDPAVKANLNAYLNRQASLPMDGDAKLALTRGTATVISEISADQCFRSGVQPRPFMDAEWTLL